MREGWKKRQGPSGHSSYFATATATGRKEGRKGDSLLLLLFMPNWVVHVLSRIRIRT